MPLVQRPTQRGHRIAVPSEDLLGQRQEVFLLEVRMREEVLHHVFDQAGGECWNLTARHSFHLRPQFDPARVHVAVFAHELRDHSAHCVQFGAGLRPRLYAIACVCAVRLLLGWSS
jgi:hypothetical protein